MTGSIKTLSSWNDMTSILLSIVACFGWGTADFIGGLKSRKTSTLTTLAVSTFSGTVLLAGFIFIKSPALPETGEILWALPAGIFGLIAMYLLYQSLSIGSMAILAPISATGVILPVAWGILGGDDLSGPKLTGIIIAICGAGLAAVERRKEDRPGRMTTGAGLAAGSALLIGIYFILMDKAAAHDPVWASMVLRGTSLIFISVVFARGKTAMPVIRPHMTALTLMGIFDSTAALCFAMAVSHGMLSEVAVISSLYPAVTVLLSAAVLRDRVQSVQAAGVVMALTGVVLISAF